MPHENSGSVLPDVAEGAEEVIPVKRCSQVILRALVAGSRSRNHVTNNFRVSTLILPAISPTDWRQRETAVIDHTVVRLMSVNRHLSHV